MYSDLTHKKSILEAPFCIKIYFLSVLFFSTGNTPCFKSIFFFTCSVLASISIQIMRWYCSLKVTAGSHMRCVFFSAEQKKNFFVNFSSWKAINSNDLQQSTLTFSVFSFFCLPFLYVMGGNFFLVGWRWGFEAYRLSGWIMDFCLFYDKKLCEAKSIDFWRFYQVCGNLHELDQYFL